MLQGCSVTPSAPRFRFNYPFLLAREGRISGLLRLTRMRAKDEQSFKLKYHRRAATRRAESNSSTFHPWK